MLHILYRICEKENFKKRPYFFSKKLCLENFLQAFQRVENASLHLICDGDVNPEIISPALSFAEVKYLPNVGNSNSFWTVFESALDFPEHDLIYFVEDDYLHCLDALEKLLDCYQSIPCDYITLYDHPVRYMPNYAFGEDWLVNNPTVLVSEHHHWREVESTCMTFASNPSVLRADYLIFKEHTVGRKVPNDRELFRQLQHLGCYKDISSSPTRRLIGPIPSLATHCEEPWLAPVVIWEDVVNASR